MYGYSEYRQLNKENILARTTEEEIFKIVLEEISTDEGHYYSAPYRVDNEPNCKLRYYDGILYFTDWADLITNKNCFKFIQACYKLDNIQDVYEVINEKLSLGLGDSTLQVKKVIKQARKIVKKRPRDNTITIIPRNFNGKDKKFWLQYGISSQNLIDDKVIPIQTYRACSKKGEKFTISPFDVAYAYTDFKDGKKKIYRPYGNKVEKWLTNCNQNDIGSINFLNEKGELLIISKSYKDCRVLRNLGLNSVWVQSERMMPSKDILKDLCSRYTKIVIWFDNDNTGIASSIAFKEYINSIQPNKATTIILPPTLLSEGIKDPADMYAKKGKQELINFLIKKKLYEHKK